jgi:hypothetical protein
VFNYKRNSLVRFVMVAVLSLSLGWNASSPADAQQDANFVTETKVAIDQLLALKTKIPQLASQIGAINFGPFSFSGKCDYNKQWYCFGLPCNTEKWTYKPNFGSGKAAVQSAYQNLGNVAKSFDSGFSATRQWLLTTVPQMSAAFGNASTAVDAAVKQYNDASSNPAQKTEAKTLIIHEIENLISQLNASQTSLRAAVSGVSRFQQSYARAYERVGSAEQYVAGMFASAEKSVNNYPFHCGRPACMAQLKAAEASMRVGMNIVKASAKAASGDATAVDNASSKLLGSLVALQGNTNGVLTSLNNAKITPTGAVQQLRLAVAQQQWNQLADYARQKL